MPPNDFQSLPSIDSFLFIFKLTSRKKKKRRGEWKGRERQGKIITRVLENDRFLAKYLSTEFRAKRSGTSSESDTHGDTERKKRKRGKRGEEGERNERTFNISDRPGWPRGRVFVKTLLAKSGRACVGNGINLSMRTVHPFNIHHAFITAEAIRRLFSRHAVFSSLLSRASSFGPRRPSFLSIGDFRWGWCCCRCCFRCCRPTSVSSTLHTRGRRSERIFTRSRDTMTRGR